MTKYVKQYSSLVIVWLILSFSCDSTPSSTDNKQPTKNQPTSEISRLDSLIEESPRNAALYYNRAKYHENHNNLPKALTDAYSAVYLDSTNIDYLLYNADLYVKNGKIDDAIQTIKRGITLNKENEILLERAIEYNIYAQDYEAAIEFSNDLLRLNKYNTNAYFLKGLTYKKSGNLDKAASNFQTCVELDPEFYNAYMQLGLIYDRKSDHIALQYFDNALRINADSREAKYAKAYFYQKNGKTNEAIKEYKEMVKANPKDHEVFFNIGHCYIDVDSLEKSYINFDIATKIQPQYTGAYYMKGLVSEQMGNLNEAKINYKQALQLLPNDTTIANALQRVQNAI